MIEEIIGLFASIILVVSLLPRTTSYKGTIIMRALNMIGSIMFVVYGCLLPAISTGIANGCLVVIDLYYLIREIKDHKKKSGKMLRKNLNE